MAGRVFYREWGEIREPFKNSLYSFININETAWTSCLKRKQESGPLGTEKTELPSCQHVTPMRVTSKIERDVSYDLISSPTVSAGIPAFTTEASWHMLSRSLF